MKSDIENAYTQLRKGGVILYPTDTVWGLGCDATQPDAVSKIYEIKQRDEQKALLCLVSDFKMLAQFVHDIPETAYDIMKYAQKPTTIIYDKPVGIAENLIAPDGSMAFRVVRNAFCQQLIKKLRTPLVSTSANISGKPTPHHFSEISSEIKSAVDYVVSFDQNKKGSTPSTIIKLKNDGTVQIIRS